MKDKIIKNKAVITADMLSSADKTIDRLLSKDVCDAQIEEMAKIMCGHDCEECAKETAEWRGVSFEEAKAAQCLTKKRAELLYNAGCRIIAKDSVVLTKGAYESISSKAKANVVNAVEIRNEIVVTILRAAIQLSDVCRDFYEFQNKLVDLIETNYSVKVERKQIIPIKQFGVEIKGEK